MITINLQQKKYKLKREEYQLVLPIDYEVIIPEDDSVRLLSRIIEGMDLSALYAAYSEQGRNPAVKPKNQFKIMVYAYMEGNYSTRKIESACRRDVNYMWLLSGEPAPDHSTISLFRKERLGEIMEGLFYQFVQILCSAGEVKFENIFEDGTKIEANANRYTFVWKKAVEKNELKMQEKARVIAEEMSKLYLMPFKVEESSADADMYKMITFLENRGNRNGNRQRQKEKQRTKITGSPARLSSAAG